ncbi:restriction endonuclease subunit S [Vibrio mimicus]
MANKWPKVTIESIQARSKGAIAIGPFGSRLKSDNYVESGVPVIRGTNISSSPNFEGDFVFITSEKADTLGSSNVYQNDLVFPHRGAIGEVGIVEADERYVLSSSLMKLTVDSEQMNPMYLYYFFKSRVGRHELLKNASTVGTPGIGQPLTSLKSIEFLKPPLGEQNQIVEILKTLDNKITLNRQINQTLEQMAQTLFKSWFVDFDPVMDNALDAGNPIPDELQHRAEVRKAVRESEGFKPLPDEVRQLFPDAFEESELGWVPKGWGISTAGDEFTVKGGSTPSTKNAEFWEGGDIHWTSPKDLSGKAEKIMLDTERKITAAGLKKITSGLLPENSVLMSSRAPIGYLALAKIPVAINQGYIAIPSTTRLSQEYALYWLDSSIDKIKGIAGGTTFAEISKHTFKSIKMIVPDSKVTDIFSNLAKGYLDKITLNVKEVATLTKLCDTLLPKLISGELRLDEVELAVEQEAVSAEQQNER